MALHTRLTERLGIVHPIVSAPAVGLIHDVPSAREIVERIGGEAEALLRGASGRVIGEDRRGTTRGGNR